MRKFIPLFVLALLFLGYAIIKVVPGPKTEIVDSAPAEAPATPAADSGTPEAGPTPVPGTPTPTPPCHSCDVTFLTQLSMNAGGREDALPRHGLIIAFLLPLLFCGIPGILLEIFIIRYVQPRGIDLSTVRIKAQDGLFIEVALSMTARRTLRLASTRMTWPRVRNFVEKSLEQELIHEALYYATLDELERNLKLITDKFLELPVVQELSRDFGVKVLRFNAETRYPTETMDALNRRADASAAGTAYLAFAAAARLDPDSDECRQLYTVFQETMGRVDAARNLGGGITGLAELLAEKSELTRGRKEGDGSS